MPIRPRLSRYPQGSRGQGRLLAAGLGLTVVLGCGGSPAPTQPSALPSGGNASPAPNPTPAPAPSPAPSAPFALALPVAAGDTAHEAYGLWPFGVHGGGHALDGHPGWDVEFRPGALVRAAADGVVQNALPESGNGGRFTIRINHQIDGRTSYATDYTNLSALEPGIAAGAAVTRGQPLGPAGVQTQTIGTTTVTWGMTHFQMNDFSRNEGLTNPNAVSPEPYLDAGGRGLFNEIWQTAAYQTEWCEPFPGNARAAGFPLTRRWLQSGTSGDVLDVSCPSSQSHDYTYTLRTAGGAPIESGVFVLEPNRKPLPTVDFRPAGAGQRLGVYDVVSGTMRLHLAAAGAGRPVSLSGALTYTTE